MQLFLSEFCKLRHSFLFYYYFFISAAKLANKEIASPFF